MQLFLPSPINYGVTPGAVALDSLVRRLYNERRGGPWRYPAGVAGLGFDYYDLLDQAGLEDCSPRDEQCVSRNTQRQVAVEDLWTTQYMTHADTATKAAPVIDINTDDSQRAFDAFMANQGVTSQTIQVGSGPVYSDAQYEATYLKPAAALPPAPAPAAPPKPNQSVPPTTPLLPMATGFQNTAATVLKQVAPVVPLVQSPADEKIFGMDQKTVLIVAGLGAAALFFMGRR